jgi:hypothetical protein
VILRQNDIRDELANSASAAPHPPPSAAPDELLICGLLAEFASSSLSSASTSSSSAVLPMREEGLCQPPPPAKVSTKKPPRVRTNVGTCQFEDFGKLAPIARWMSESPTRIRRVAANGPRSKCRSRKKERRKENTSAVPGEPPTPCTSRAVRGRTAWTRSQNLRETSCSQARRKVAKALL